MALQTKAASAPTKVLTGWQRFASVFREAHPMGREPQYLKSHNLPGAMYYFRRLGRTSSMFVPVMVGFCKFFSFEWRQNGREGMLIVNIVGWPFLVKGFINASNEVKAPKAKKAAPVKSAKMSRKSSIDSEAWSQRAPAA